jgi:DNA-binding transcriptional ArsR family regulator
VELEAVRNNVNTATILLKAMANERRLLILYYLAKAERSVGELGALVGIKQPSLSQHLARLREDGLVHSQRSAQNIHYSLTGNQTKAVMLALDKIFRSQSPKFG